MKYLFPFDCVEKNSRIVIYGAGVVGSAFWETLQNLDFCQEVLWVDRQYKWYQSLGLPVQPIEMADGSKYDQAVIAVENLMIASEIKTFLLKKGFEEKNIVWKDYVVKKLPLRHMSEEERQEAMQKSIEIDPKECLTDKRMDLVIRTGYARELLGNISSGCWKNMYEKFITAAVDADEPVWNPTFAYFSDYEKKQTLKDFEDSFLGLLNSMKNEGFRRECFVPVDSDRQIINGAHRVAAAIALDKKIWIVEYPLCKSTYDFSLNWLEKKGFTKFEIEEILWIKKLYCLG